MFDATQPIRRDSPAYVFPNGFAVRQVLGENWQSVDLLGRHIEYIKAEDVVYESSLVAEYLKSRSIKQ